MRSFRAHFAKSEYLKTLIRLVYITRWYRSHAYQELVGDAGPEGCLHQDHLARCGAGDPVRGVMTMARDCLNCEDQNGLARFKGEPFTIEHAGQTASVENLSGWRCRACGEVEFDAESARRYAAAGDALVLREPSGGARRFAASAASSA